MTSDGPELTLRKATRLGHQEEAFKEQQVAFKMDKDGEESVHVEIDRMKIHKPKEPTSKQPCWRCGNLHDYGKCPAYRATCHSCHSKGHFKSQCPSRKGISKADERLNRLRRHSWDMLERKKGQWVTMIS